MRRRILFADNNPKSLPDGTGLPEPSEFLKACSEFLKDEGYFVDAAFSAVDALQKIQEHWYHLLILDNRLEDDDDVNDNSGALLAMNPIVSHIPRIILTAYEESLHTLIDAIRRQDIVVLRKQDHPDVMLETVNRMFAEQVRINWGLKIVQNDISPVRLLEHITEEDTPPRRFERAEELEDLLRKAFYEKETIQHRKILWSRQGRVSLLVSAGRRSGPVELNIVTLGDRKAVKNEADRYRSHAPGSLGDMETRLQHTFETTHFAANVFSILAQEDDDIASLAQLRAEPKAFGESLKTLFQMTLPAWHRQDRSPAGQSLESLYRDRLHLGVGCPSCEALDQRVKALAEQSERVDWQIGWHGDHLTFQDQGGEARYACPVPLILRSDDGARRGWTINGPGTLSGSNVACCGKTKRAWVTDFVDAGPVPVLWNFTSLEAEVRFDWFEVSHPRKIAEFEEMLTPPRNFEPIDFSAAEPPARPFLRAIHEIRALALPAARQDITAYHRGMFFHAAHRLVQFDPQVKWDRKQLTRFAHLLLAAAILASDLTQTRTEKGLRLDAPRHGAWLDGNFVELTAREFALLSLLYHHDGICTYEEIFDTLYADENWREGRRKSFVDRVQQHVFALKRRLGEEIIHGLHSVGYGMPRHVIAGTGDSGTA